MPKASKLRINYLVYNWRNIEMKPKLILIIVSTTAALALTACGGGNGAPATTAPIESRGLGPILRCNEAPEASCPASGVPVTVPIQHE